MARPRTYYDVGNSRVYYIRVFVKAINQTPFCHVMGEPKERKSVIIFFIILFFFFNLITMIGIPVIARQKIILIGKTVFITLQIHTV